MARTLGKGKTRQLTKKEKQTRLQWQQDSEEIGKKYVYPAALAILVVFFLILSGVLYSKANN